MGRPFVYCLLFTDQFRTAEVSLHSYRFAKFSVSNANIQNRVRAAFDNTDGFHGGVDENRLGAGQPHGSKIQLEGLFCVCHWVFSDTP